MRNENGAVLILVFMIMTFLVIFTAAFLYMTSVQTKGAGLELASAQAFWVAEAGLAKAKWALTTDGQAVGWGETASPFGAGKGTYIVTTAYSDAPVNEHVTITSEGYVPDNTSYIARRRVVESDMSIGDSSNLSSGAVATASSSSPGHPASDAIDGSTHTRWAASAKDDAWLKLNFGSATTFDQVVIIGQKNIDSVTIDYSNNDVAYSSVTNMTESPAWTFTFDSVTAKYLRVNMDVDWNKKAEVDEMETYDTAAGEGLGQGEFSTIW